VQSKQQFAYKIENASLTEQRNKSAKIAATHKSPPTTRVEGFKLPQQWQSFSSDATAKFRRRLEEASR
jgi:hypothetical protein